MNLLHRSFLRDNFSVSLVKSSDGYRYIVILEALIL